jgi:hypothetical protein
VSSQFQASSRLKLGLQCDGRRLPMDARSFALWVCAACLVSAPTARASHSARSENRPAALIVGSSSIRQSFGRVLAQSLEHLGYRVTREGVTSAGFARPDFRDVNAITEALPISGNTAVVLVYLGLNDGQALWLPAPERRRMGRRWLAWSDARWSNVYEQRVRRYLTRICARGARRVLVLLPVDVARPRLQRRLNRIRKLQARAAAASSCGAALETAGDWGRFGAPGRERRRRDGFHMTEHGARVIWGRIRKRVLAALDLGWSPGAEPLLVDGRRPTGLTR